MKYLKEPLEKTHEPWKMEPTYFQKNQRNPEINTEVFQCCQLKIKTHS